MNKLDQERGKTTEKNHRYCFSVISGRCFMLFFMCLMASWYRSGTGTSRESNIHRNSLSPRLSPKRPKHILILVRKSHVHHSHPVEHLVSFCPLFQFIILDNPDYEPTPPCDERQCTGVFSLPDINPFVLFGSDTRSLSFALPAGQGEQIFQRQYPG